MKRWHYHFKNHLVNNFSFAIINNCIHNLTVSAYLQIDAKLYYFRTHWILCIARKLTYTPSEKLTRKDALQLADGIVLAEMRQQHKQKYSFATLNINISAVRACSSVTYRNDLRKIEPRQLSSKKWAAYTLKNKSISGESPGYAWK